MFSSRLTELGLAPRLILNSRRSLFLPTVFDGSYNYGVGNQVSHGGGLGCGSPFVNIPGQDGSVRGFSPDV